MIPQGVEVFVAVEPVDMRLGFERLGGLVRERMAREPRSKALFVFFGKRRETVKVLEHRKPNADRRCPSRRPGKIAERQGRA